MSIDFSMKVLVVDSDSTHRDALVAQLSAEGFTAFSAGDGESALIAFDEHAPDLVLLEKSLPGLDGAEVCEALKERAGTTFIPIVFIASLENASEKTAGYDAGARRVISTPC
jgi:DNA-binding response OmpR family regulator